jgi:pimeloyl-ACP methyl ester carboxylesterase
MRRDEIWFTSAGARCAAWWFVPDQGANGRCIVMAHGFSLTRHDGLSPFAERFAAAGFHVLAFDHRFLGDSGGQPRQRFRIREQQADWRNAIAYAEGRDEVVDGGVILWGYSFSGGHVARLASERDDLAAALVLCPFVDGLKRVLATPPSLSAWVLPRAVADLAGRHNLIAVTDQPGAHAAMAFPGEADGFAATVGEGSPWRNEISPGLFALVAAHRPVTRAKRISCPLWVGLGETDVTTDAGSVECLALNAPGGELYRYPYDHFQPFGSEATDRIAADQLEFLERHGLTG